MHAASTVPGVRSGHPHRSLRSRPPVDDAALRVAAERQRIGGRLHDEVSPLLFAIASGVQRAELRPDSDAAELREALRRAGDQVAEAAERIRALLRDCSPAVALDGVPAAAHRDVQDFADRSGVRAELRVRGTVRPLVPATERALLAGLRLALCNVEQHARASAVDVTLDYSPGRIELVVCDDGRGLPAGFELPAVPAGGHRWGLSSIARQVEQLGGTVEIADDERGRTRLRVHLPD